MWRLFCVRLGIYGLSFDHLGAGNEVVDAAAVLAEDEADIDETISTTNQRDGCDQSVYENAQQDRFYTARIVSVRKGADANAEYFFAKCLAASGQEDQGINEQGEEEDNGECSQSEEEARHIFWVVNRSGHDGGHGDEEGKKALAERGLYTEGIRTLRDCEKVNLWADVRSSAL